MTRGSVIGSQLSTIQSARVVRPGATYVPMLTSVESPLPQFVLGQLMYCYQCDANRRREEFVDFVERLEKLRDAIRKIYETDKALRDTRPDDRVVMEQLVLSLT